MKKTAVSRIALTMALLLATIAPLSLRSELKIYKFKGDVTVNGTRKAVKRLTVKPSDMLTIPRDAAVSILDTKNNRVFSSLSQGKLTVENIIDQAQANSSNVTRATNEQVIKHIAESGAKRKDGHNIPGASVHVANAVIHAPVDLPKGMSYLSYLRELPDNVEYCDEADAILLARDINYEDETFNFAVFNTLSKPLYFNIIQQRTDREPELHFLDNPIAAPRTMTKVQEYLYILPDYPDGYIVIASDKDFTLEDVKKLLDPNYEPTADFYITLLRK